MSSNPCVRSRFSALAFAGLLAALLAFSSAPAHATQHVFGVRGEQTLIDGRPFKVIGLRCSNALISDATAGQLIDNLDTFRASGVNTVSVYLMGSRFGDVKGYLPDATLDPFYAARLGRIIEAADARGMIVLVGCLYWSDSKAREGLAGWGQAEANRAIANTVAWLKKNQYRNVFVDPDNEGMAHRGAGFDLTAMIDAAHAVDQSIKVAWNDKSAPAPNADLLIHHSPRVKGRPWLQSEGSPDSAPGGYWGSYSKQKGLYNYINIGVHSEAMKRDSERQTRRDIEQASGYMLASTWLQCVAPHGPNMTPGGDGSAASPGVRWWLEFVKQNYGPWSSPQSNRAPAPARARKKSAPDPLPKITMGVRFERAVDSPRRFADPIRDADFYVNYVRPDGTRMDRVPGFFDGGAWRIRVAPDQPGRWRYGVHFGDDPTTLVVASGGFDCLPAAAMGQLVQMAGNPIWFGLRGGKPILLRSLHVGDRFFAANWPAENRKAFLDWAGAQGYNMLSVASCLLNRRVEGRGLGWQTPELWDSKNHRPNPAEYQKLEAILDDLARRRIYVHPFAGFFGQSSNFPTDPAEQELYLHYTIARLGVYWNLLFSVAGPEPLNHAKQFYNAMGENEIARLGLLIQKFDACGHLISIHNPPGDDPFARSGWSTYVTLQGWKDRDWTNIYQGMLKNHADKPLLAHEVFWPGNTLGHGEFTDGEIRKKSWVLLMAAATINFGDMRGNSSSGFSGTLDLKDRIQKRHDIVKQVWDLFEMFPYYRMRPRPDLVDRGFCLAEEGKQVLVYLPEGGSVKLVLEGRKYQGTWINPSDPKVRRAISEIPSNQSLTAPGPGDWLLELK